MYMYEGEAQLIKKPALITAVWVTAIVTLFLGILPAWGYDFARAAVIETTQFLVAGG